MEYMKLEGFLGRAVSKLVNKGLESKLGVKPGIDIQKLNFVTDDAGEYIRLDVSVYMSKEDFEKVVEEAVK